MHREIAEVIIYELKNLAADYYNEAADGIRSYIANKDTPSDCRDRFKRQIHQNVEKAEKIEEVISIIEGVRGPGRMDVRDK